MIQRIQSVYLFLALLALGALFSRLPLIEAIGTTDGDTSANEALLVAQEILIGSSAFITLFSIFLYANRKRQMMAVRGALLLTVLGLIAIAIDYFIYNGRVGANNLAFDPFALIGTVALILQVMGLNGIKKDEKLVREADRLR